MLGNIAGMLDAQLKAAGLPIIGVSIGANDDKSTWTVQPPELQAQAQPIIDAINLVQWKTEGHFATLRVDRNARLADCDWTHTLDVPLTADELGAWAVYRQALRDLPSNTVDPENPVWPTEPV